MIHIGVLFVGVLGSKILLENKIINKVLMLNHRVGYIAKVVNEICCASSFHRAKSGGLFIQKFVV